MRRRRRCRGRCRSLCRTNENVHKTNGKISFKIKAQIGTFVNLFGKNGEEVLCCDGYIRNTKEADIDTLKVWDRSEAIALLDKMHQKVIEICETNLLYSEIRRTHFIL